MNIFSIIREWFFKKKEIISDNTITSCHNVSTDIEIKPPIAPPMRQVTKGWFTMHEESKTMDELKVPELVKPKLDFNQIKFCKDCKYFNLDSLAFDLAFGRCHHRKSIKLNDTEYSEFLVSGNVKGTNVEYYLCSVMRHEKYGECGEEAKFFEPKENT